MVCVVVTRGGFGDLWLLGSREEAFLHPIVQYGDAILSSPADVCSEYNWMEWGRLRMLAGLVSHPQADLVPRQVRAQREQQAPQIFEALKRQAQPAPTDPAEICRIVSRDRRNTGTMARKNKNAPTEEAQAPAAEKTEGSNLPAAQRGPKGVPLTATISFGSDKDGKQYSATEHNPKKEGSKTRARFALYMEGMTIEQALDARITTADLVYDKQHGFISFADAVVEDTADAAVEEDTVEGTEEVAEAAE